MDHQIQHHRHIIGAIGVGAVATRFKHHHLFVRHHLGEFTERGIETLDMTHLKQTTHPAGSVDQSSSLLLARSNRLLDQHV